MLCHSPTIWCKREKDESGYITPQPLQGPTHQGAPSTPDDSYRHHDDNDDDNNDYKTLDFIMTSPPPQTFTHIPVLPLSAALDESTKPQFLRDLRSALLNVGFLYLSETGLPDQLVSDVIRECGQFFEKLPLSEKERIEMKNEKSFLGWSRVSLLFS